MILCTYVNFLPEWSDKDVELIRKPNYRGVYDSIKDFSEYLKIGSITKYERQESSGGIVSPRVLDVNGTCVDDKAFRNESTRARVGSLPPLSNDNLFTPQRTASNEISPLFKNVLLAMPQLNTSPPYPFGCGNSSGIESQHSILSLSNRHVNEGGAHRDFNMTDEDRCVTCNCPY